MSTDPNSLEERIKLVDEHVQAEVERDLDKIMRTWGENPDFDDVPWDEKFKGRDGIRHHYDELLTAFPDLDIIVRTYNGESIGTWEGDTLVVDTIGFRGDHHWMDQGGVAIPAGEQLHIVERFRMVGNQLEIEYTMTDPENWEGEWKSTKRFNRVIDEDIQEVSCLPDLNEHLQSTTSKTQVLQ